MHCHFDAGIFTPAIKKKIKMGDGTSLFYAKKNRIPNPDIINGGMDKVDSVVITD